MATIAANWLEEQPVKLSAEEVQRAAAEAAIVKRKKLVKVALGVGTGVLVALFIALSITLAVTYTRSKDDTSSSPTTTVPVEKNSGVENGPKDVATLPKGPLHSQFYTDATTVVVTPLTADQKQALSVTAWPAAVYATGHVVDEGATQDRDLYVEQGQVAVSSFISDGKKSSVTTVLVSAGDLVTVPGNLKTTFTYTEETTVRTKTY